MQLSVASLNHKRRMTGFQPKVNREIDVHHLGNDTSDVALMAALKTIVSKVLSWSQ